MAKTLDPFYATGVANIYGRATAAKTNLTDNTNAVLVYTAPTEGAILTGLRARALGTFTDTVLMYFTSPDGTNLHLKGAIRSATGTTTVNTTNASPEYDLGPSETSPRRLAGGERVYVAASVALAAGWVFEGDVEAFS